MVAYNLKIRTFQPSDTPAIHRIFTYGMTEPIPSGFRHAAKLPKSVALWSTGPLAAISTCAKFVHNQKGGVRKEIMMAGIAGSIAWTGALLGMLYWSIRAGYTDYISWSLQADLKDIKTYYRLEESEDENGERKLVPTSDSQFWVCTLDEEVVGFVALDYQVDANGGQVWELRRMIVSPHHRKMGIAKMLITTLLNWARDRGATNVELMTSEIQAGAMKLYERFGWKEENRIGLMYGVHGVKYRLDLTPGEKKVDEVATGVTNTVKVN